MDIDCYERGCACASSNQVAGENSEVVEVVKYSELTDEEIEKLLDELVDSVILHHASKILRHRMAQVLYKHIPFMDEGCYERGCPCVDDEHSCLRKAQEK